MSTFTKVARDAVIFNNYENVVADAKSFIIANIVEDIQGDIPDTTALGFGGFAGDEHKRTLVLHSATDGSGNIIIDLSGEATNKLTDVDTLDGLMQVTGNRVDFSGVVQKMVLPDPGSVLKVDNAGTEETLSTYIDGKVSSGQVTTLTSDNGLHQVDVTDLGVDISSDSLTLDGFTSSAAITVEAGGVNVTGSSIFSNLVTIQDGGITVDAGGVDVTGASTFSNGILAIGADSFIVSANGNSVIDVNDLGVDISNSVTLTSDLTVESGGVTVEADGVNVTGASTFSNAVTVEADGVDVTGASTFSNAVTVEADGVNVTGASTFSNAVTVEAGGADITGDTTITGNLTVTGTTTQTTIIRNQFDVSDNIIRVNQANGLVRDSGMIFMNVTDASDINAGADVSNASLFFDANSGAASGIGSFVLGFVTANDHSGSNPFTLVSDPSGEDTEILADLRMGTLTCTEVNSVSDLRLKKDVKTLSNSIDTLQKLRPVSYKWKDSNLSTEEQIGVIAQEVEEIVPSLVSTNSKGQKAVAYQKLTALLIDAVKQQQKEIDELKRRFN
jgi:hypothetical protein